MLRTERQRGLNGRHLFLAGKPALFWAPMCLSLVLGPMLSVSKSHPCLAVAIGFIVHALGFVMVPFRGF